MRFAGVCLFLLSVGVLGHFAFAQAEEKVLEDVTRNGQFEKDLFKFYKLRDGGSQPGKGDDALINMAAEYYIYRVTSLKAKQDSKFMKSVVESFENQMASTVGASKLNQEFTKLFSKAAITKVKDILELDFNSNKLACINAAIMIPSIAQTKQESVADYLVQVINDPKKHEAIKLYACKGLKEFPPARMYTDEDNPTDKGLLAQRARDKARIEALLKMLDHKWPMTERKDEQEGKDPEVEAVRFIRREVVAALAQTQVPASGILLKKKPTLEGPTAYGLIRILAKDGVSPSSSLSERCEAAVGLCQLKPPSLTFMKPDYQPHVAVFLIGKFLTEYVSEYRKDFTNRSAKKLPYVPWKLNSERLMQGMDDLKVNLKFTAVDGNFVKRYQDLLDEAKDTLVKLKATQSIEEDRANRLGKLVEALRPKGDEAIVFRSFKKEQPAFTLP